MRMIFVWLGLLAASVAVNAQTLTSPDGNLKMQFHLSDEGAGKRPVPRDPAIH